MVFSILMGVTLTLCWYLLCWLLLVSLGGLIIGRFKIHHNVAAGLVGVLLTPFAIYLNKLAIWHFSHGLEMPLNLNFFQQNWIMVLFAIIAVTSSIHHLFKPYKGLEKQR
ncbi:membrane hypothetical protein [Vibrio chagasii]|nr:membrane hypothetical protein [Vibrio chagasii]